ncbi:MAG: ATP-binding protein [Dehalococcoidia bacterium]|jgi:hypothetical protein
MPQGRNVVIETPKPVVFREKLSRKILRPLMAQFSSLSEALLELVDNIFDEFDGVHGGNHLDIDIVITKRSVTVENLGGKGMGKNELNKWLIWGDAHKSDAIGEYGQGGKAAMGYIGSSWIAQTKRWDQPWLWEIKEDNWDDVSSKTKSYKAVPKKDENKKRNNFGYCKFEIRKLKKRRQDINRIKAALSNIYRKHLEEGKARITLNYEPVSPLKLPIYEGFKTEQFKKNTSQGFNIYGWIGRLKRDVRVRGGPRITGGMRLLRKGRLILDGEYFGHPDYRNKASLGTLIGEVELTKVPVLPNKTGFDVDSTQWDAVHKIMHSVLAPHIDDLLKQREEDTVSREERKRVSQVRVMMIEALKRLSQYDLSGKFGGDKGRKQPENQEVARVEKESEPSSKKREPRTPPPEGAVGRLKRLSKMPEWELRDLEPDIRSDWGENQGRRCLLINRKYCLYEEREGDPLYIAESAALQLARPDEDVKFSLTDYLNEVNLLMRAFCEVYESD